MILGRFRYGHPRATLHLPGTSGPMPVEFIVDTGFEGDLAVPGHLASRLAGAQVGFRRRMLADGLVIHCPFYEILLDWSDEPRITEVLALLGHPLLGTALLEDYLLQVEIGEGGEVLIDPL